MAIFYADQNDNKIRLLQSNKAKLSTFISNEGKIRAIINCSFFAGGYVVGRNQGDERNDTVDQTNFEGNNLVIFKDGGYKIGYFNSWDYQENVVAGFCPIAIYRNGNLEIAPTLKSQWTPNNTINRTALCYNKDGYHFCVATAMNYKTFLSNINTKYNPEFIAFLDSGGSSELILDKKLQFTPSDGKERLMFNGLAFVEIDEPSNYQKPIFPTKSTWISQGIGGSPSHMHTKAIDFGTWSDASLIRLGLPMNYDYPIKAPFDCKVTYVDTQAKGAGLALESIDKVTYSNGDIDYCTVWIGHSNDTPKLGTEFKQNDLVCHFGDAGGVPKHMHLEVIKGKFSEIYKDKYIKVEYIKNVGNVYLLENTIAPNYCLYFTSETYVEDNPYDWKKIEDKPDSKDEKIAKLQQEVAKLNEEKEILEKRITFLEGEITKSKDILEASLEGNK